MTSEKHTTPALGIRFTIFRKKKGYKTSHTLPKRHLLVCNRQEVLSVTDKKKFSGKKGTYIYRDIDTCNILAIPSNEDRLLVFSSGAAKFMAVR